KLLESGTRGDAIHELCMNEMTDELKPSRYHYISHILAEEFEEHYERLKESGMLTYETVNLVTECKETFEAAHFSETNQECAQLRGAIFMKITNYLAKVSKIK